MSGGGGGGGGGTISSSMAGSEYSLPPSYRSRNATPASLTLSSDRTIETAPSGRLLANEDLPEPSTSVGAEQLPDYSALQSQNTLLTSAIVEIESRTSRSTNESSPAKTKDLVTIVTISQGGGQAAGQAQAQAQTQTPQPSALDQIDILAHL